MSYNPYSLERKSILVTGASSGIGQAIAIECSKLGANVIITARNAKRLNDTFSKLEGDKKNHLQIITDLTKEDEIIYLVSQLPKLDGCVNNAGIVKLIPTQFISSKEIENIHQVNLIAPMLLTKYLVRKKIMNNPSSIVFTSSVSGVYRVSIGNSIYATSKCGIDAFMRTAALELAPKGIRCNSVNPAMVETKILDRGQLTIAQYDEDRKKYPLGRYGTPVDVAYAVIFLLSDASSWITGSDIKIDGGITLN